MKLTPKQFDHLADIMKEAGAIIFGGLAIGSIINNDAPFIYVLIGVVMYIYMRSNFNQT